MAKKTPFTPKPPVEKLPLAVRKDLRDSYESKKADYESQLSESLGISVTLNIDVNQLWAYGEQLQPTQAASIMTGYIDGLVYAVKTYVEKFEDVGKEYFKDAVTKSQFTIAANELGDDAPTISADVKDGVFRILFHHTKLGYNQSYLSDEFAPAIDSAPHPSLGTFGLLAKHSIKASYEDEIAEIQEEIGKVLAMSDVKLDPNFEENYAALDKKKGEDQDWRKRFGEALFDYFKYITFDSDETLLPIYGNLKGQLVGQGFDDDEMLQEGFAEAVESKTFKLRVVDKTKSGSASEVVIEGGVVYINVGVDRWWYNVYDTGEGLINLL